MPPASAAAIATNEIERTSLAPRRPARGQAEPGAGQVRDGVYRTVTGGRDAQGVRWRVRPFAWLPPARGTRSPSCKPS